MEAGPSRSERTIIIAEALSKVERRNDEKKKKDVSSKREKRVRGSERREWERGCEAIYYQHASDESHLR